MTFKTKTVAVTIPGRPQGAYFGRDCDYDQVADVAKKMLKQIHPKMKQIGSGCYGDVYGHASLDMVFKIGAIDENDGYLAYVEELRKQKEHNPYTPRIYGVQKFKAKGGRLADGVFVVAMEKLSKSKTKQQRDALSDAARWFDDNMSEYCNDIKDLACASLGITVNVPPDLVKAMAIMEKAYNKGRNCDWDFHSGNFMIRNDNQLVCIDPLA